MRYPIIGLIIAAASLLAGCSKPTVSNQLNKLIEASAGGPISFKNIGPAEWDRVCFLHPYSNNARAAEVLGFPWNAEGKTSIRTNDGINVIVFVKGDAVVDYVEHPRNQGDFASVDPRCIVRDQSVIIRNGDKWRLN